MGQLLKLPEAVIYTDGSSGQDRSGGWSAIVATPAYGIEIAGFESDTTNNRMEVIAAIKGMKLLHEPHEVSLVSDSAYLLNTIQGEWYLRWFNEQEQWKKSNGKYIGKWKNMSPRPNLDLWLEMSQLLCYHRVKPIKVKGHDGVEFNERVDKLAFTARKQREERFVILYGGITGGSVTGVV